MTRALADVRPVPRLALSRVEAAMALGIGETHFDSLVAEGVLPKPVSLGSRKVWLVKQLEHALSLLADDTPSSVPRAASW